MANSFSSSITAFISDNVSRLDSLSFSLRFFCRLSSSAILLYSCCRTSLLALTSSSWFAIVSSKCSYFFDEVSSTKIKNNWCYENHSLNKQWMWDVVVGKGNLHDFLKIRHIMSLIKD